MERNRSTVFCHSLSNHIRAFLRTADDDHFLLFKLMDAVDAALLDAVRALFLAEARGIACERLGQVLFLEDAGR